MNLLELWGKQTSFVYSTVCLGADQRKHQSSASLAFVWGIHRWPVNSPHTGPVTRPFDDVIIVIDHATLCTFAYRTTLWSLFCIDDLVFHYSVLVRYPLQDIYNVSIIYKKNPLSHRHLTKWPSVKINNFHDYVIKWKHFPRHWPFVRGIHQFTSPGEFPAKRPVTRSFDVFFDLRMNKRLSKQSRSGWFETQSRSFWRQCNEDIIFEHVL